MLLRHAKSSWDDRTLSDFDRPLNDRGRQAAPLIGGHLCAIGLIPDQILCSTAVRTRETCDLVNKAFPAETATAIAYDDRLYHASSSEMLEVIKDAPAAVDRLLVIGHNPGIQILATSFAGDATTEDAAHLNEKYPTAALTVFDVPNSGWRDLNFEDARLRSFTTPKRLASA